MLSSVLWVGWLVALIFHFHLLSSFLLVLGAWRRSGSPASTGIAVGMTLGFLGDGFMAADKIAYGMLLFSFGHAVYLRAFFRLQSGVSREFFGFWLGWLTFGFAAWMWIVGGSGLESTFLRCATLFYTLLICSMATKACEIAYRTPKYFRLAAGAMLFVLSDLLLSIRLFQPSLLDVPEWIVWALYGPAQMLIVFSYSPPRVVNSLLVQLSRPQRSCVPSGLSS